MDDNLTTALDLTKELLRKEKLINRLIRSHKQKNKRIKKERNETLKLQKVIKKQKNVIGGTRGGISNLRKISQRRRDILEMLSYAVENKLNIQQVETLARYALNWHETGTVSNFPETIANQLIQKGMVKEFKTGL